MEKQIKLPYQEYVEMQETIKNLNRKMNTAIMHEGNMIIDNRATPSYDGVKLLPKISGKIPEAFTKYSEEFEKQSARIAEIYNSSREAELALDRKHQKLDDQLDKKHYYKDLFIGMVFFWITSMYLVFEFFV